MERYKAFLKMLLVTVCLKLVRYKAFFVISLSFIHATLLGRLLIIYLGPFLAFIISDKIFQMFRYVFKYSYSFSSNFLQNLLVSKVSCPSHSQCFSVERHLCRFEFCLHLQDVACRLSFLCSERKVFHLLFFR